MNSEVKVKKVKAYPIVANLKLANGKEFQVKIIKLENVGFYIETEELVLTAGVRGQIHFQRPVQKVIISANVVLVKSIDSYAKGGQGKSEVVRLLEFHFLNLTDEINKKITEFKKAIGQK